VLRPRLQYYFASSGRPCRTLPEQKHVRRSTPVTSVASPASCASRQLGKFSAAARIDLGKVDVRVDGPEYGAQGHQNDQYDKPDEHRPMIDNTPVLARGSTGLYAPLRPVTSASSGRSGRSPRQYLLNM